MKIETMVLGQVRTNCYLVIQEDTKEAVLVDAADRADVIGRKLADEGLMLKAVFLTHGHGDHILAVEELKRNFGVKIYAAEPEADLLEDPRKNLSEDLFGTPVAVRADVLLKDGQKAEAAGMTFQVIHTPGHTPGGCCYYQPQEKVLFSGDTLFHGSVGRTDFPGGSMSQLVRSVREKLLVLPEDVTVYPGHEGTTAIGFEKKHNPFLG